MKKWIVSLLMLMFVVSAGAWARSDNDSNSTDQKYGDQDQQKVVARLDEAANVLNQLTNAPDNGIPQSILAKAKCVAIVPKLAKAAFVFGGEHGRGVATCRLENGSWSAPAFLTITGGSWGAQIGGEEVNLVMLFMNDEGANKLMQAKWKIAGDAGIAVGPYGRQGTAATDWKANTAILTYSKAKGAFIGISLDGANVHMDENATKAAYGGRMPNFRASLTGKVPPPTFAHQFLAAVRTDFREANATK